MSSKDTKLKSLRFKILIILMGIFLLYGLADFGIQRFIIYPTFLDLENNEAVKDANRCVQSIQREIYHLDGVCHDYAAWDDTYEFIHTSSEDYIKTNLVIDSFINNRLNLIYLCDEQGQVVWGEIFDLETKEGIDLSEFRRDAFLQQHPLVTYNVGNKPLAEIGISGLMMTQKGPLLISSRPIVTSKHEGPIRGSVIMAKFIDQSMITTLAEQTQVKFQVIPIQKRVATAAQQELLKKVHDTSGYHIEITAVDSLDVFTVLPDIHDQFTFLFKVTVPRKISTKGTIAVQYAVYSILTAAFVTLVIMLLMTERAVLNPITKLTRHALSIATSGDPSARLNLKRMDEIGRLAQVFNQMLEKLAVKTSELEKVNQELLEDVAIRRRTEEELSQAQALLSAAVEQTPAGIIIIDAKDLKIRLANSTAIEILGSLRPNQWQAFQPNGRLSSPDELPLLQAIKEGRTTQNTEIIVRRKDGEERWVLGNAAPVRDEKGEIVAGVMVFPDITEQKRNEKILRRSEEKYRLLVENAHDGIFILQKDGIKFANPSTLRILGYTEEELTGIGIADILHSNDRNAMLAGLTRCLQGKKPSNPYSFRVIDKEKNTLWLQMTVIGMFWEEEPAVLCFIRDVSETRKLETQLLQTQRMESIGTLAGGIAHDFNNILSPIIGYTELAMQLMPETQNRSKTYLQRVLAATSRAVELVQQILTFSRQSEQEMKPLLPHLVVKEALKLLRASIPANIHIEQEIDANCSPIMANTTQIHQIIMNLCTNAYHAMEDAGGRMMVTLNEVDLSHETAQEMIDFPGGRYVQLTVSDAGKGMTREIMDKIFDPFFTTKPEGKGTGLGLSVVHGIVKSHGGRIKVDSGLGQGTTFTIYFPISTADLSAGTSVGEEPIPTGSEHILLVDDEPMIIEMEQEMLEELGYRVSSRTSSIDALEAIRANGGQYDLIISDVTMPQMTGDELARHIRQIHPGLPVILCTGFSGRITPERARALGVAALVMKPIQQRTLATTIRNVLEKSGARKRSSDVVADIF